MQRQRLACIFAVAAGSTLVAWASSWSHPDTFGVFSESTLIILLSAAVGGAIAGTLFRPATEMFDWSWFVSFAFAIATLFIAATAGGFLLGILISVDAGALRSMKLGFFFSIAALFYLGTAAMKPIGIFAIGLHILLIHLTAKRLDRF